MLMQKKAWMILTLFKGIPLISKRLILGGHELSINSHILISKGHGFHDSLEAIEHAQKLGLDIFTYLTTLLTPYNCWIYHVLNHSRLHS